jgi:hypothetical protein
MTGAQGVRQSLSYGRKLYAILDALRQTFFPVDFGPIYFLLVPARGHHTRFHPDRQESLPSLYWIF